MKKDFTELVFILDRSGSMEGLQSDTIGGFNSLLSKQRAEMGEAVITTVLFDDQYELLHDRINIKGVKAITPNEYYVRGTTALLDAIGKTLSKISNVYNNTAQEERPEKVMFVITTDGHENSSREYSSAKIKAMIEKAKESLNFEFMFLGANIDAVQEAENFGIDSDMAVNYCCDEIGTQINYRTVSNAISELRKEKRLSRLWRKDIDEYYEEQEEYKNK